MLLPHFQLTHFYFSHLLFCIQTPLLQRDLGFSLVKQYFRLWFVKKRNIAGTPGNEAAHIHIDNLGLPSWQVSLFYDRTISRCPDAHAPIFERFFLSQ